MIPISVILIELLMQIEFHIHYCLSLPRTFSIHLCLKTLVICGLDHEDLKSIAQGSSWVDQRPCNANGHKQSLSKAEISLKLLLCMSNWAEILIIHLESCLVKKRVSIWICLEVKEQTSQSCASYAVQGIGTVFNGYGLRDSKWSPFMKESWDNNLGISADLIAAQAVHHYI
ncbi:Uncharacterized protein Rs2_21881 [Raphanus sativus]|nr:Uncharacterized protein Rs2_21881 [Raphanus sativus]